MYLIRFISLIFYNYHGKAWMLRIVARINQRVNELVQRDIDKDFWFPVRLASIAFRDRNRAVDISQRHTQMGIDMSMFNLIHDLIIRMNDNAVTMYHRGFEITVPIYDDITDRIRYNSLMGEVRWIK